MPNKKVPTAIAGQELCEASRARTARLLSLLEEIGVEGIADVSNTDRFRLLAHHLFVAHGRTELAQFETAERGQFVAPSVDNTPDLFTDEAEDVGEDVGAVVRIGMSEVVGVFDETE